MQNPIQYSPSGNYLVGDMQLEQEILSSTYHLQDSAVISISMPGLDNISFIICLRLSNQSILDLYTYYPIAYIIIFFVSIGAFLQMRYFLRVIRKKEILLSVQNRELEQQKEQLTIAHNDLSSTNDQLNIAYYEVTITNEQLTEAHRELSILNGQLTDAYSDLSSINNKLSDTIEELAISNTTKDKFFSIIAHDLRNPITAMINVSTVFEDNYDEMSNEQTKDNINLLTRSSNHLATMLENLLN